jgi:hypothetical protein
MAAGRLVRRNERQVRPRSRPPDGDGKTWSFAGFALGGLWFFNARNRLAASPAALLIPRELAERDGSESADAKPKDGPGSGGSSRP